jgi:hypothetical protein
VLTEKELPKKITLLPSKAWWLFFAILILGVVAMFFLPKKSSQPLLMYLPQSTNFYYHWSDKTAFENLDISKIVVIDSQEPSTKIAKLKNLLQDGFLNTNEIIWFKTNSSSEDNYLLHLDEGQQISKWLVANHPEYSYLLIEDDVLLLSIDSWLPNHYTEQAKIDMAVNNIGSGVNIFWSKNEAPIFLASLSDWLKLDSGLPNIYANINQQKDAQLNIHVWQAKLRQMINASSASEWPNKANFPLGADLILGFGDHESDKWQNVLSESILQPIFTDLPYYRLSIEKIREQILKNNYIYLADKSWLMVSKEDWQAKINDWVPNLSLKEEKNRLPDGTVYTEYVSGEEAVFENLSYQGNAYWHYGAYYGAQIDQNFYLSNSESLIQATLATKYKLQSNVQQCEIAGNYQIIDLVQINSTKIKDESIKKGLLDKNINNLTIISYENDRQIGFRACFR